MGLRCPDIRRKTPIRISLIRPPFYISSRPVEDSSL